MRLANNFTKLAHRTRELGPDDWLVELSPSSYTRGRHPWPASFALRLIRYQRPGFRESYLLTSLLDPQTHSREELINLYHLRWRIETIYREWKQVLDIQNLRSHTPLGLHREMHAQMLLSNLVRYVMAEAVCNTAVAPVELSFTEALRLIGEALTDLLRCSPEQRHVRYQRLLSHIAAAKIKQRPNRSYPRRREGRPRYKSNGKRRFPDRLVST